MSKENQEINKLLNKAENCRESLFNPNGKNQFSVPSHVQEKIKANGSTLAREGKAFFTKKFNKKAFFTALWVNMLLTMRFKWTYMGHISELEKVFTELVKHSKNLSRDDQILVVNELKAIIAKLQGANNRRTHGDAAAIGVATVVTLSATSVVVALTSISAPVGITLGVLLPLLVIAAGVITAVVLRKQCSRRYKHMLWDARYHNNDALKYGFNPTHPKAEETLAALKGVFTTVDKQAPPNGETTSNL